MLWYGNAQLDLGASKLLEGQTRGRSANIGAIIWHTCIPARSRVAPENLHQDVIKLHQNGPNTGSISTSRD